MQNKSREIHQSQRGSLRFSQRMSPRQSPIKYQLSPGHNSRREVRKINILELSSKIEQMESKIKDKAGKGPPKGNVLFHTTSCEGLAFKREKGDNGGKEGNNKKQEPIKPKALKLDQLRTSWDPGASITLNFQDRKMQAKKDVQSSLIKSKKPFAQSLRTSLDMNPEFGKSSAKLKMSKEHNRIQIPRLQGNYFSSTKPNTQSLFRTKQLLESQTLDQNIEKGQYESPKSAQNRKQKVKDRIRRSLELIEMLQSQEPKKDKKGRRNQTQQVTIVNDFELAREVGSGKFGEVYLARHIQTNFVVAIKKVSKAKIKGFNMVGQFIKEVKLHSSFDHPKIAKFYGMFELPDSFCMILEYMNGGTLFQHQNKTRTLPIRQATDYLRDVIEAVTEMHSKNIIHRDIKPENIVLTTGGVAKLCDFGWATVVDRKRRTFCGTLEYVSPQILGKEDYDFPVDIWGIGVLTYEMLMGRSPFESKNKNKIKQMISNVQNVNLIYDRKVPVQARDFVAWLLRKDPQKRPKITQLLSHEMFLQFSPTKSRKT